MKNKSLLLIVAAAALALTACGGGQKENVQTAAAQTTAAAPAAAPAAQSQTAETAAAGPAADAKQESKPAGPVLPEEYEPVLFEGIVTGYEGSVITVEGGEGTNSFDISRNEEDPDQPVIRGCYVEVSYADSPVNGVYPADSVSVLNDNEQLAEEQGRDPVIYGRLQYMDINEITIFDDAGRTIDFDGAIARSVSFGELGSGDEVAVTYCGSIHREETSGEGLFGGVPFALKVVAMDALRSEEAQANYVEGTAGAISGGNMTLSTEIGDLECSADPAVYEGIAENDKIRVFYTGSLADIVLAVERVEKL